MSFDTLQASRLCGAIEQFLHRQAHLHTNIDYFVVPVII